MKKLIIGILIVVGVMMAAKSEKVQQLLGEGSPAGNVMQVINEFAEEYSYDAIANRVSNSMKIDHLVRDFKQQIGNSSERAETFFYQYCSEKAEPHEQLDRSQLHKVCEYARSKMQP